MAVCFQKTDLKAKALTFREEAKEAASYAELQARVKWEGSREGGGLSGWGRDLMMRGLSG